jgi:hypothetical protein
VALHKAARPDRFALLLELRLRLLEELLRFHQVQAQAVLLALLRYFHRAQPKVRQVQLVCKQELRRLGTLAASSSVLAMQCSRAVAQRYSWV